MGTLKQREHVAFRWDGHRTKPEEEYILHTDFELTGEWKIVDDCHGNKTMIVAIKEGDGINWLSEDQLVWVE